jgi:membrane protein implicated in regulation of membrane protease activity
MAADGAAGDLPLSNGIARRVLIGCVMVLSRDGWRRLLGVVFLAIAGGMLLIGQTVLKDRLQSLDFVYYWLTCTVFTGLTLIVALLDMRVVRRRARQQQSELLKNTLREINLEQSKPREKSGEDT